MNMLTVLIAAALFQDKEWGPREWGDATKSLRKGENWSHHYIAEEGTCPLCSKTFAAAHVGTHTTAGVELDFKTKAYVSGNPYLFALWMCPTCNFCAWAGDFNPKTAPKLDAEKVKKALGEPKKYESYFDIPYSVLLKRAEQSYAARDFKDEAWAWLYLFGAWVARDSREKDVEKAYHAKAREKFEIVAEKGEGNNKAAAAYLVGEIHRRYGNKEKAKEWLDKAEKIAADVKSENIPDWIKSCREELEKK